ncbi:uncharacterized protein I303_102303 [Kwoniella dejecticola CBS 10117]|uniref:Uncharacterized protein n=1 Tax=Kwoniella dejecticola CBS 10117 TaxID=1296121 RepID=A0A1A6ABB4_9TREE|nr:uncharacterized protein I303_01557 [Kwoniella dejecticola CBS 10117]OBR87355.1 hypothetical protein I303_01557 [Kwoniella dejecticola CBS 10117]
MLCLNWRPWVKFHPDEDGFDSYIGFLINDHKAQLEFFTWHGMDNSTFSIPWFPSSCPKITLTCTSCGGFEPTRRSMSYEDDDDEHECRCASTLQDMVESIRSRVQRSKQQVFVTAEIVNLTCLGGLEDYEINAEGKVLEESTRGKSKSNSNSKYKTNDQEATFMKSASKMNKGYTIKVVSLMDAEPCICCGQYN